MANIIAVYNVDDLNFVIDYIKTNNPFANDWTKEYIRNTVINSINNVLQSYYTIEPLRFSATMGFMVKVTDTYWRSENEFVLSMDFYLEPFTNPNEECSHFGEIIGRKIDNNLLRSFYND